MLRLINANMKNFPPIKPIGTSKPVPASFNPKSYFQYHPHPNHDTKKCYR